MKKQTMVVGVLGIVIGEDGKFLLTQRHQPQDPEVHLKWQLPGGGMEFGETPEQTLAREMQEEIGVSVRILHPLPIAKTSLWDLKEEQLHVTLLGYVVSIDHQQPKIGDAETAQWKWYTIQEMHSLDTLKLTQEFVEEAKKIVQSIKPSSPVSSI